jgi:hypothetical protein
MLFYHRTDPDTAERILRDGFPESPGCRYLLSLESTPPLRGSVLLGIALPPDGIAAVLKGWHDESGALYLVRGSVLRGADVSIADDTSHSSPQQPA